MQSVTSNARAFFEYIKVQPDQFAYLSSIPDENAAHFPFFEEEWIDFKGRPQDDKDAKKIWSKALSGFANITDGLIIWGIDARKMEPRAIDAASGLRLIPGPFAFESKLRDWIRDATNPPVREVEFFTVPGVGDDGFVVCLVPESTHKPHRAEWADRHYYYRASDDFLLVEPGMLRTLFYPQFNPQLWIVVSCSFEIHPNQQAVAYRENPTAEGFNFLINQGRSRLRFQARIHNDGTASAKEVYIVVQNEDSIDVEPGNDWTKQSNPQGQSAFKASRNFHPGEVSVLIGAFSQYYNLTFDQSKDDSWLYPHFEHFQLRFLLYADGMQRQTAAVAFLPEDFLNGRNSSEKRAIPES